MTDREFRKIPSLQFLYEVSEDGRIFRNVKSKKQSKIIVDYHHSKAGYCFTWVNLKGKVKRVAIAHVVAECWLGEKPEGLEVDHINRNSLDNYYQNLRYVTKSEQMKNRDHSKISATGKKNLLTYIDTVKKPLTLIKEGLTKVFESQTAAARYLAAELGKKVEQVRRKFKERRKNVYGYKVIYRNVETACVRSTEQGTVQLSLFDNCILSAQSTVGTTLNNPKNAKE